MTGQKTFEIRVGFGTDKGRVREMNEDSYCAFVANHKEYQRSEFQSVLGVADGMGGHKAGDIASRTLTTRLKAEFIQQKYKKEFSVADNFLLILKDVVRKISREIFSVSKEDENLGEIGSTLTFGVIRNGVLYLAHVGDSRCYCIRDGTIKQITKDHSWVADQVSLGMISKEEALNHPNNNIITQAVGFAPNVEPQMLKRETRPGDRYIFCSDGLTASIREEEILQAVCSNPNPQRVCDFLIDLANQRGGQDNITVVIGYINVPS